MEVRGRNLVTGLPKTVTVTSSETEEALRRDDQSDRGSGDRGSGTNAARLSADILDRGSF